MKDSFVVTRYGRIHYLEAGQSDPLVLLHSNGCSAHEYDEVILDLSRRWRVLAPDMPGQGDSDPITRHYSIEMYAEAIVGFLDALGVKRAAMVGASVGGSICLALARDHAERMESVVLVEAPLRSESDWRGAWGHVEANFSQPTQPADKVSPRFRAFTTALHERWNIDRNKAGGKTMIDVMWAMREFDSVGALQNRRAPAAALLGIKGPVMPGKAIFERCLGSERVVVLPECGHFPMIDNPGAFIGALEKLLVAA